MNVELTRSGCGGPGIARSAIGEQSGFSIVEVLVAIVVFSIAVLGALTLINVANLTALSNDARTGGVNLARQLGEGVKAVPASVSYGKLTTGCAAPGALSNPCALSSDIVTTLMNQPGLAPDASSPPGVWQITRDDIAYTVKIAVCSMDDAADGYGSHGIGGPYCADAPAAGSADADADDYKRATIDVSWANARGANNVRAVVLINSSATNGPSVTCLAQTASSCPSSPLITNPATTSISFTATLSGAASRLEWTVDGAFQGSVSPSGSVATFTWNIGTVGSAGAVVDGSYEVGAIAYDQAENIGTVGTVQVQINRQAPSMPGGFMAGRNTEVSGNGSIGGVDLDWLPVADKDVLYYRVYSRTSAGAVALEYQTGDASETAWADVTVPSNPNNWGNSGCSNPLPPDPNPLWYYVVAVDQNGTSVREGTPTSSVDVNGCNHKPSGVTGLSAVAGAADGSKATLSWTAPSGTGDIDSGDSIAGYRIYRWAGTGTSQVVRDRYDHVVQPFPATCPIASGSLVSWPCWVDNSAGSASQNYCVRSVDTHMQESTCSSKVTYP